MQSRQHCIYGNCFLSSATTHILAVVGNAKTKTRNMTLNSFKLILILGLLTESAMAQSLKTDSVTNAKVPMPITISYYSNLIVDPGFKVGIERPFLIIQKSKIIIDAIVTLSLQIIWMNFFVKFSFMKNEP